MTKKDLIDHAELENFKKYLATNPRILVIVAENIDPDAIGGSLAMFHGLKSAGIRTHIVCRAKIAKKYKFLDGVSQITADFDENEWDGIVFIDCGDKKMAGFQKEKPEILSEKFVKINIDHHASNDHFGEINFVSTDAASATILVFRLLQKLKIRITPGMATALLAGIYGDTGSFMHQNTTPDCYFSAAELVRLGANVATISKNLFRTHDLRTLKLWGKVLGNLHVTADGAAIVGVERKDYESLGASREDLEGVIDFINSMPEAKYSVLLSEDEKGNVKASLRTRNPDLDVKALAERFGGGGHVKAAGFTIPSGHLEKEVKWKIVTK